MALSDLLDTISLLDYVGTNQKQHEAMLFPP